MEDLILQQVEDEEVHAVREIILDEWRGSAISASEKSLLETYVFVNFLSLSGCGLASLSNFPELSGLMKLDLSMNRISEGLDNLSLCTELLQLNLSSNLISDIDSLRPLANLPNLLSLELADNSVTDIEDYREKVFELCSSIEVLDGLNAEGQEVSLEDEEISDDDFSPSSDSEDFEKDEDSDFEPEEKSKRKRRGGDVEPRAQKHRK
jgi:hypothetical protein